MRLITRHGLVAGATLAFLLIGSIRTDLAPSGASTKTAGEYPGLCTAPLLSEHQLAEWVSNAARPDDVSITILDDVAVVLEYSSIFAVHTPVNPALPLRSQGGGFLMDFLLTDLARKVDASKYDFLLLYSIGELPGWIHSGARGIQIPAKNIGLLNSAHGQGPSSLQWRRLRASPHMNAVDLLKRGAGTVPRADSTLTAAHEMSHYWNVFWAQDSPGPRGWNTTMPIAWLGAASAHWSYVWEPSTAAGIMYSAALSPKFTAFDLYGMGLMSYAEASQVTYRIHEDILPPPPNRKLYDLKLDDLIFSLQKVGSAFHEGNGRRIPETDPSAKDLTVLIVVVKGQDEVLTDAHKTLLADLANNLPSDWSVATNNLSSMKVAIIPRP